MSEITKEILARLPDNKISEAGFEGANIVLYTKDTSFFLDNYGSIRKIVDEFRAKLRLAFIKFVNAFLPEEGFI